MLKKEKSENGFKELKSDELEHVGGGFGLGAVQPINPADGFGNGDPEAINIPFPD